MATALFDCNNYTLEGIKKLKICTQQTNGEPIVYPTDFTLYQNNDGIIAISENPSAQTITIGSQVMNYLIVDSFDMCEFSDERQETRQGKWFEKKISIVLPKVQLYTNNQLVDFLFNVGGKYAVAQCIFCIEDSLGQQFLIGYDVPAVLLNMELQTDVYDSTDNKYLLEFSSKSYSRLRRTVVV